MSWRRGPHLEVQPPGAAVGGLGFFLLGQLRVLGAFTALSWILYRAWLVLIKPVDELISTLGVDLPEQPSILLACLKADSVLLHWKPSETQNAVVTYQVWVNGKNVSTVPAKESPVTVSALRPEHSYSFRIVSVNSAGYQAASFPIYARTLPSVLSDATTGQTNNTATAAGASPEYQERVPEVRYTPAGNDGPIQSPPPTTREHSGSQSHARRNVLGRRGSPVVGNEEQQEDSDTKETLAELTDRLTEVRGEIDQVAELTRAEENAFNDAKIQHLADCDQLRPIVKGKEDANRELKKNLAAAERSNTSAQARKTSLLKQRKQLESKQVKLKGDARKWESETQDMTALVDRTEREMQKTRNSTASELQMLRSQLQSEQGTNKTLEEDIHSKGISIKSLEEGRFVRQEHQAQLGEEGLTDWQFKDQVRMMTEQYKLLGIRVEQSRQIYNQYLAQLEMLSQRRSSQAQPHPGMPLQESGPSRRNSLRRPGAQSSDVKNPMFAASSSVSDPSTVSAIAGNTTLPPFSSALFNIKNGTPLPINQQAVGASQPDLESLNGGAPMSPTAGADLIPSGLFGDDVHADQSLHNRSQPSLSDQPGTLNVLPGLGAPQTLEQAGQDPSSPASIPSRSPSVFTSPRESSNHLAFFGMGDNAMDSDRRSVRSTASSLRGAGGSVSSSKFSSLFGLNRQRGKTVSGEGDEGPALGSLKSSQTSSMPRQISSAHDLEGTSRRRGSYSGSWMDSVSSPFMRGTASNKTENPNADATKSRMRPFSRLGARGEGSHMHTSSSDQLQLPEPSTQNQRRFGWPIESSGTSTPSSQHSHRDQLGSHWNEMGSRSWFKGMRQTPNKSMGSESDFDELDEEPTSSPTQAPIGTRPSKSDSGTSAKLNPTAPNFKSFFSKSVRSEKADKAGEKKSKSKSKGPSTPSADDRKDQSGDYLSARDTPSPSESRKSRDPTDLRSASVTTASESRSSLDRSPSRAGAAEPADDTQLNSSSGTPTTSKENFMQKISRKSSSAKFNFSFGGGGKDKDKKGTSTPTATTPGGTLESGAETPSAATDEDAPGGGGQAGSSGTGKTVALSWSSLKRIRTKKGGDKTPSLHESNASESVDGGDSRAEEESARIAEAGEAE